MAIDFPHIEAKWQAAWAAAKIGEVRANRKKPKFFMIFAYPYPSGYQHVGHFKGYTYTDIITRYKRMAGFNVLFPVGVHASGNIALAFALKVQKKDSEWLAYLRRNGATEDEIAHMTDPYKVVEHFNKSYIETWKGFGFIADWQRFTCTVFPDYEKFIRWQFLKLHKAGLLTQGPYFGTFCPAHGPVAVDPSETDISKGGNAEKLEYTLLKFKFGTEFIVAATLRPETVFGQTNLWVHPDVEYERALVGDEVWIGSHEFFEKLREQRDEKITIMSKAPARELMGEKALAPGVERKIPILPATFASPVVGTGIVTSVPSDAPYDYIALEELKHDPVTLKKFGIPAEVVQDIEPISIIKTRGYGDLPAVEICQKLGIKRQTDPALEQATAEIYKLGFHTGVMKKSAGHYANLSVPEAKEKIAHDLKKRGLADIFYDLSEEVLCRCGLRVIIKKIPDQWFIKYSDEGWKNKTKAHIKNMRIWPADYAKNLPNIIDWFQDRSCARLGNWLGTRLPFDERWTIEPIGDSTLYPAYYIVSKYVNSGKLKAEDLTEQFFDYVFLGKGRPRYKVWHEAREDFLYWYPLDINLGGKEHQTVHFPVFTLNHVAVFNKEHWPKGIFVHWWIIGKGGKISKSKGGAQPIPGAIERFTVDGLRLFYAHGTSAFEDTEWDEDVVATYRKQVERIVATVEELAKVKGRQNKMLDLWLISRLNSTARAATASLEAFDLRKTVDIALFDFIKDLQWYQRRGGGNRNLLKKILSVWLKLLSPFIPHIAEELWQKLGNKGLISKASWPSFNDRRIKPSLEASENAIENVTSDIRNIVKIVGKKAKSIYLYVIPKELEFYKSAEKFLGTELDAKVKVFSVADPKKKDPQNKASKAKPGKPGVYVET